MAESVLPFTGSSFDNGRENNNNNKAVEVDTNRTLTAAAIMETVADAKRDQKKKGRK